MLQVVAQWLARCKIKDINLLYVGGIHNRYDVRTDGQIPLVEMFNSQTAELGVRHKPAFVVVHHNTIAYVHQGKVFLPLDYETGTFTYVENVRRVPVVDVEDIALCSCSHHQVLEAQTHVNDPITEVQFLGYLMDNIKNLHTVILIKSYLDVLP